MNYQPAQPNDKTNPSGPVCNCGGRLDATYGIWFRCRLCNSTIPVIPEPGEGR